MGVTWEHSSDPESPVLSISPGVGPPAREVLLPSSACVGASEIWMKSPETRDKPDMKKSQ